MGKQCKKCLKVKTLGEFYRHSQMADGRLNKCKACTKADVRENRESKREYYQQYDRKRWDEKGARGVVSAEAKARAGKAWVERNGVKRACHVKFGNAVRDGKISRPTLCSKCGGGGEIEGHHADYSKPFDVEWLCKVCHGETRKMERKHMIPGKRGGYVGNMKPSRAVGEVTHGA